MNRRAFLASLVSRQVLRPVLPAVGLAAAGYAAVAATPAAAQEIPQFGIPIPWFRSRAERLARRACEEGLPECRADVRRQLMFEREITLYVPWFLLGFAVLGVLFYMRKKEKEREKQRRDARRKHVPGAFKKLDQTGGGADADDMDTSDTDRFR